jgi:hypothetical protein
MQGSDCTYSWTQQSVLIYFQPPKTINNSHQLTFYLLDQQILIYNKIKIAIKIAI